MKRMKSILAAAVLAGTLVFAFGCREEEGELLIGISKIVAHPALDALERGIQDEVKREYPEARFDNQNANGEMTTAVTIAQKFRSQGVNAAVGIATPTAQALAQTITELPVIFCAVTDPVNAGLIESTDSGAGNITGSSDMTPVRQQLELLAELTDIETLGQIYTNSEANAVRLAEITAEVCADMGIEYRGSGVTNSAEVKQAAQTLAGQVDAFYVSTDNTVVSALAALSEVAAAEQIPLVSADTTSAADAQVLFAWGFDYYKMGRATGRLVVDILQGQDPESIPTLFMTEPADIDLLLNKAVAADLGITFPEKLIAKASTVLE